MMRIQPKIVLLLLPAVLLPMPSLAQPTCGQGTYWAVLESDLARARVGTNGSLFPHLDGGQPPGGLMVPKNSGIESVTVAQVWVAGLLGEELLYTGHYSGRHYYPGPLDAAGRMVQNCHEYNIIHTVSRRDLQGFVEHKTGFSPILSWPATWGAPVVDGDGIEDDYRPDRGDCPALVGQESAWWVMNDGGNVDSLFVRNHRNVGLQAEVFSAIIDPPTPDVAIVYFKYRFTYARSAPLEKAYFGIYMMPDLGDPGDDLVGSDTLSNTGYVYNDYPVDAKYGTAPPVIGVTILKGPLADPDGRDNDRDGQIDEPDERLGMTAFIPKSDEVHEARPEQSYRQMQGLCWVDGFRIYSAAPHQWGACQDGGDPELITSFWYTGDPVTGTGWIEDTSYSQAFMLSSGPFSWQPGQTRELEFFVTWARGKSNLDSITRLRGVTRGLLDAPEFFAPDVTIEGPLPEAEPHTAGLHRVYPNPANKQATVGYTVADRASVHLELFDGLGRMTRDISIGLREPGTYSETVDTAVLPSGVYFFRLRIGRLSGTGTFVVAH